MGLLGKVWACAGAAMAAAPMKVSSSLRIMSFLSY
jgi:hypothetical protein